MIKLIDTKLADFQSIGPLGRCFFYKSICPYVCVSVCVRSLLRYRLNVFLTQLLKVGCQLFFRDWEALWRSKGKKWSQIWKLLLLKSVKLPRKKKWFWANFALLSRIFLVAMILTPFNGLFSLTPWNLCSFFFFFCAAILDYLQKCSNVRPLLSIIFFPRIPNL